MKHLQTTTFFGLKVTIKASGEFLEEISMSKSGAEDVPSTITNYVVSFLKDYEQGVFRSFDYSLVKGLKEDSKKAHIYQELVKVKPGHTVSYKELAANANLRAAYRFVGTCMRLNMFPIVIPCHRVLKSDLSLGQYSFGGPEFKKRLLEHEKKWKFSSAHP